MNNETKHDLIPEGRTNRGTFESITIFRSMDPIKTLITNVQFTDLKGNVPPGVIKKPIENHFQVYQKLKKDLEKLAEK